MRKYFVIKAFNTETFNWEYLKRTNGSEVVFNKDVRWAIFYRTEDDAMTNLMQLSQDKDYYYSIETIYHKF